MQALLTIDTLPLETLLQFADHAGVGVPALAQQLQREGTQAFINSWNNLLTCIDTKRHQFASGA
jgi:hypothetical protein